MGTYSRAATTIHWTVGWRRRWLHTAKHQLHSTWHETRCQFSAPRSRTNSTETTLPVETGRTSGRQSVCWLLVVASRSRRWLNDMSGCRRSRKESWDWTRDLLIRHDPDTTCYNQRHLHTHTHTQKYTYIRCTLTINPESINHCHGLLTVTHQSFIISHRGQHSIARYCYSRQIWSNNEPAAVS